MVNDLGSKVTNKEEGSISSELFSPEVQAGDYLEKTLNVR
jgi:hypothetical protein